MIVTRGDVVILDVPYADRPGSKFRPVLIVQNDHNNARMENTIVATITTNITRGHETTQVLVDSNTPEGKLSGLFALSTVSCENLFTVRRARITRKVGHLPDALMQKVDQALKVSLSLP